MINDLAIWKWGDLMMKRFDDDLIW